MRTFLLGILLCVFDLAFGVNYPPTYYIPAGGQTINNLSLFQVSGQTFYVTTSGAVNLGSNTYTLTYASLPSANTTWNVIFDASNLTLATATNVNLFGETPLATYSPTKKFYINFSVVWDAGVPSKKVTYFASLADLKTFVGTTNFNGRANFNDTVVFYNGKAYLAPVSVINTGNTVVAADTSGKLTFGCTPWCILGNSGIKSTINFLGTTDTAGLNFRVNNYPSGRIDYNLANTSLGYGTLHNNTSATQNVAIGFSALFANTTGGENVGIGYTALSSNTIGTSNVSIGSQALSANTSGNGNTALGYGSLPATSTGNYNTAIGYGANSASGSTTKAIAIGYNAVASSNQLAIAGIRSISIPNMTSSIRYVLTDTSGTGDFIPQPYPQNAQTTLNPLTGDSVIVTTSANLINPAGTIANFTLRLPASPYSGQLLEFSTTQTVTTLHWSVALNQKVAVESHVPTTLSAGGTIKIMYNSATSTWCNY